MPEMTVSVRWPDGTAADLYSPSLVMHDHLSPGTTYSVEDFVTRSARALAIASERVQARYGFACTSAAATLERIERETAFFAATDLVEVLRMHPPLPQEAP